MTVASPYPAAWHRAWQSARIDALRVDPDLIRALHWCRIGNVRPIGGDAFHRAKQLGLLAQDSVWRATERGEGVLVALGILDGKPAPQRTTLIVLWGLATGFLTPNLVATWSEWEDEVGDGTVREDAEREFLTKVDGRWTFWTTVEHIDIPEAQHA